MKESYQKPVLQSIPKNVDEKPSIELVSGNQIQTIGQQETTFEGYLPIPCPPSTGWCDPRVPCRPVTEGCFPTDPCVPRVGEPRPKPSTPIPPYPRPAIDRAETGLGGK